MFGGVHVKAAVMESYRLDMLFKHFGDVLRIFSAFFRDQCEVANLKSIVLREILQGLSKIICEILVSRKGASR